MTGQPNTACTYRQWLQALLTHTDGLLTNCLYTGMYRLLAEVLSIWHDNGFMVISLDNSL